MDILILNKLLAMTKLLSKSLQSCTITYTQASREVTATIHALKRCSTDEEFINEVHDEVNRQMLSPRWAVIHLIHY